MPQRKAASTPSLTLLLPRLSGWIPQLDPAARYPALEQVLARGRSGPPLDSQLDAARMRLFGADPQEDIPVAALGLLASGSIPPQDHSYHLRLDPVTLQADMSRVRLLRSGFGGFTAEYRRAVELVLQQVLSEAEMTLQPVNPIREGTAESAVADYWAVTVPASPGVRFIPLDEALGADISDCLPAGAAGRPWRILANEIQMALHAMPENEELRARGAATINGAWFWGGGGLPVVPEQAAFDRVFSVDPVSSGLARLQQAQFHSLGELLRGRGFSPDKVTPGSETRLKPLLPGCVLVDWAIPPSGATEHLLLTPDRLEAFIEAVLDDLKKTRGTVEIYTPDFHCRLQAGDSWRFWRRSKPLLSQLRRLLDSVKEPT